MRKCQRDFAASVKAITPHWLVVASPFLAHCTTQVCHRHFLPVCAGWIMGDGFGVVMLAVFPSTKLSCTRTMGRSFMP